MRDGALEQRLFDVAPDAMVVTAIEGGILRVNRAACVLVGLSQDELLSRSYWDLIHPADHGAVAAQHEELRRDGQNATPFRCRILRPDGSWRWVESSSSLDTDAGLIFSVVRDITGREDVELERLATLFDHAPIGMAVMAPGGALRRVNKPLADMLGRTEAELLEHTIFELVDDEDSRGTLALAVGARSRPAFQFETRLRRARRAAGHRALQRDAPHERAQGAGPLRLPDPRHHRARRGAGAPRAQRGQARRGPADRAPRELGVGDRDRPRDVVGRALPHLRRPSRPLLGLVRLEPRHASTPTTARASPA